MVFFNYALRKLNAKIVYYGPGLCGKTTNLLWIHDHFEGGDRGKMISLATEGDRTIFFDLLPIDIGAIRGMNVTLQLYTVPGQVHYNSTRQLVLRGADGVVFVADSQRAMQSSNIESFRNLQENLLLQGISLDGFPLVLQFNKRDLHDTLPVEELDSDLNIFRVPIFEAVATQGLGVQETLEGIVKLVMRNLRERYEGVAPDARDPATTMRVGGGPKPAPAGPKPVPPPAVAPARSPAAATPPAAAKPPAAAPPAKPSAPKAAPQPPPRPAPAPEPKPPRPAKAAAPRPPAVPPPSPPDEIVFPEEEGAMTADLSGSRAPEAAGPGGMKGFEDEVSTAVYEIDDEGGLGDLGRLQEQSDAAARAAGAVPFADEPTGVGGGRVLDHEFAIGGGGGGPDFEMDDFAAPPAASSPPPASAPPFEPPSPFEAEPGPDVAADDEEPEIEFMTPTGGLEGPPPTAEAPQPSERYVDRIEAPSPFAPRPSGGAPAPVRTAEPAPSADRFGPASETERAVHRETPLADEELFTPDEESFEPAAEWAPSPTRTAPPSEQAVPSTPVGDFDPFELGDGDPFAAPPAADEPAPPAPASIQPAARRAVDVRAEDNQLHLRLQGTGAIVESGQVRALDIEVPVPGSWVGNRRVTLQLRLTLTPDSEDGNGGSGGHS